jgi:putative membrane protein
MKRIIILIIAIIAILFGLSFVVLNPDPVHLNYFVGSGDFQLSLVLVATLAIGCLLGILASLGVLLSVKHELAKAKRDLKLKEKEITNLRALPIKENR